MIIERENIQKELNLPKFLSPMASLVFKVCRFQQLNELYKKYDAINGWEFAQTILKHQNIELVYDKKKIEQLKAYRSVIIISNHPHGILDGLLLIKLFGENGLDQIKVVTNALLEPVKTLSNNLVVVNPIVKSRNHASKFRGAKNVLSAIEKHNHIAFFPSADVSSFRLKKFRVEDPAWKRSFFHLIERNDHNILPVYIKGRNSLFYQALDMIHPKISLLFLTREFLSTRNKCIDIRIGDVFSTRCIPKNELPSLLRQRVYDLSKS